MYSVLKIEYQKRFNTADSNGLHSARSVLRWIAATSK
jgi:hypothetical protein